MGHLLRSQVPNAPTHCVNCSVPLARTILKPRPNVLLACVVALFAVLLSPVASAQTVADIEARDSLIANQEALLNVYRCLFGVDTEVVPGGCSEGKPALPPAAAQPFDGVFAEEELARRDVLVANQEALLNVYRCLFDVDAEIVPGGCLDGAPAVPFVPPAADALFYSGLVDGPGACGELEGLELYPSDEDGDGVAESCILSDGAVAVVPAIPTFTELVSYTDRRGRFDSFTCGLQTDGAISCWGTSSYGVDSPPEGRFTAFHVGLTFGCGITADQTIACWGDDKPSTRSNPSEVNQRFNWTVADMEGRYTDVVVSGYRLGTAGWAYACAIRADDLGISCWGWSGSSNNDPPEGKYTAISKGSGSNNTWCAIRVDQTLACWGNNNAGSTSPPPGRFTSIQTNSRVSCGIRADQTIACWGNKHPLPDVGQTRPPEGEFTAITQVNVSGCGIRADQAIACWGSNFYGQTDSPEGRFTAIDTEAHTRHACAIRTDQTLACWGHNQDSQGDPPEGRFTSVAVDTLHSCGIRVDGTAACWGNNQVGQADPPPIWQRQATSIPDSRLMLVAEIVAQAPFYEDFAQPYAPSRGDVHAELRSCLELGDSAQIDPAGASLALCSTAYRAATWAIDFALVDVPACAHEQFRALLTQPYDLTRLVGWADVCSSQLDPYPNGTWIERCRAVMGLVSPPAAEIPADRIQDEYCQPVTQQELDRWGRCIELIHLRVAGLRAETTAKHPDNQWPINLDLEPTPQDMNSWC